MKGRAVFAAVSESTLLPEADGSVPARRLERRRGPAPGAARAPSSGRGPAPARWLEVLLLAMLALAVRLVYLDHAPYIDELNHMLAARSLLEEGSLRINGGEPYTRSWLFTYLVAALVAVFGESLVVGRVPAVVGGTALVVAVFLWVRSIAGRPAAWVAALLVCFAPISLYLSQQVRFYTLQGLLFWAGAILVYRAATPAPHGRRRTALLGAGAVACFALAFHFQPVTAVGVAALCFWLALDRGPVLVRWVRGGGRARWLRLAGAGTAGTGAAAVFVTSGAAERPLRMFGYADLWAAHNRGNLRFYHDMFVEQFASLWTLFPLLLLLAASRFPRPTLFLATVFTVPFVFHSLAAWKHERYFFYALPFFFVIVGLAVAVALPWLRARLDAALRRATAGHVPARAGSALFVLLLAGAALFAAAGNGASSYTYRMLTVPDAEWRMAKAYRGEADWAAVLPELNVAAAESDLVVTSGVLKALYYLDRAEIVGISATSVARSRGTREFGIVAKEAVPVISEPESLRLLSSCFGSGLVIVERRNWRHAWGVTAPAADYMEASMTRLPLAERYGVIAFRWSNAAADPQVPECRRLAGRVAPSG